MRTTPKLALAAALAAASLFAAAGRLGTVPARAVTAGRADAIAACDDALPVEPAGTTCKPLDDGHIVIGLPNPATLGEPEWSGSDQLVIPAGYCYTVDTLAFHVSTGPSVVRNVKLVERDVADQVGNFGRWYSPGANGVQPWQYVDFAFGLGQARVEGVYRAGTSATKLFVTNTADSIADDCFSAGYEFGTSSSAYASGDAYVEFWAEITPSVVG